MFSNRILGYSISDRMTAKLAVEAVGNAVTCRGEVAGCILHADRGSQFEAGRWLASCDFTTWSARWAASARPGIVSLFSPGLAKIR
ncbi:hypothetical protein M3B43_10445 [Nesterenkonia massiliensis]|uniref:DDE-type integrase/transposase/recombinase n=1 Tax=Nesterenkonia massiliensis TaxID=1232429 RepID=A0ABT2HSR3_9MICC|nr:hypothetical protein [Nesterenkonia massiliensis]